MHRQGVRQGKDVKRKKEKYIRRKDSPANAMHWFKLGFIYCIKQEIENKTREIEIQNICKIPSPGKPESRWRGMTVGTVDGELGTGERTSYCYLVFDLSAWRIF